MVNNMNVFVNKDNEIYKLNKDNYMYLIGDIDRYHDHGFYSFLIHDHNMFYKFHKRILKPMDSYRNTFIYKMQKSINNFVNDVIINNKAYKLNKITFSLEVKHNYNQIYEHADDIFYENIISINDLHNTYHINFYMIYYELIMAFVDFCDYPTINRYYLNISPYSPNTFHIDINLELNNISCKEDLIKYFNELDKNSELLKKLFLV